jgi:phosphoenolpyruvate synthase/pyruvate phosphate dikinase
MKNIIAFEHIELSDIDQVGGKNSSLGEMIQHLTAVGIKVPTYFATNSSAYQRFLSQEELDKKIYDTLAKLQLEDIEALEKAIVACNKAGKYVGICGQAPSDYPELAKWLVQKSIQAISLSPDTLIETWLYLEEAFQVSGVEEMT